MDSKIKELIEHITISPVFDKTVLESESLSSNIWDKYLSLGCKSVKKKGTYLLRIGECLNGLYFINKGKIESNFLGRDGITKTFYLTFILTGLSL